MTDSTPPPKLSVPIEARRTSSRAGFFCAQADDRRGAGRIATLQLLSITASHEKCQRGTTDIGADRELGAIMRGCFAAKAELEILKAQLETARQTAEEAVDVFYDPLRNVDYVGDPHRSYRLKGEMVSLMQWVEAWCRAEVVADRVETSAAEEEPSDSIAPMSFAGA